MNTLYNISERYQNLLELCYSDNVDSDLLATAISIVDGELTDKVHNGIAIIRELTAKSAAFDAEIKRLAASKRAIDNNLERLKNYYLDNLNAIGKQRVSTDIGTMTVAKAGGKRTMIIDDVNLVPAQFRYTETIEAIDRDALRQALERGDTVEGARLENRRLYLKVS